MMNITPKLQINKDRISITDFPLDSGLMQFDDHVQH